MVGEKCQDKDLYIFLFIAFNESVFNFENFFGFVVKKKSRKKINNKFLEMIYLDILYFISYLYI